MTPMQKWIFQQQRALKPLERLLLLYYAARANGDLTCFPSFSTTADECGLARRFVVRVTGEVLCAPNGPMSVVTDPVERAAILAKAGARHNCRANVYRINLSNGAQHAPSDSARGAPSPQESAPGAPTEAEKMAALLAMCVPIEPDESAHGAPTDPPESAPGAPSDGAPGAPGMVHGTHFDGAPGAPELRTEKRESELRADAEAPTRGPGAVVRAALTGAPDDTSPPVGETKPTPEPAATTGGVPPKAPVLGAGGADAPTHGMRRPGAPPDPFADWLDQGAPPDRAIAHAIARPRPLYAPPDEIKAARQRLAQHHAQLVNS